MADTADQQSSDRELADQLAPMCSNQQVMSTNVANLCKGFNNPLEKEARID